MLSQHLELLWVVAFALLITGPYILLMQCRHAVVSIVRPFVFVTIEVDILMWVWEEEWTSANRMTWLLSFVLVGLLLLYHTFARRRWYVFHAGGFERTQLSYDMLAKDISEFLWLTELPPSTVILRYEGLLGLSDIREEEEVALLAKIDESLEDTRWRKRGFWHWFFTIQWLFVVSMLVLQLFV